VIGTQKRVEPNQYIRKNIRIYLWEKRNTKSDSRKTDSVFHRFFESPRKREKGGLSETNKRLKKSKPETQWKNNWSPDKNVP